MWGNGPDNELILFHTNGSAALSSTAQAYGPGSPEASQSARKPDHLGRAGQLEWQRQSKIYEIHHRRREPSSVASQTASELAEESQRTVMQTIGNQAQACAEMLA